MVAQFGALGDPPTGFLLGDPPRGFPLGIPTSHVGRCAVASGGSDFWKVAPFCRQVMLAVVQWPPAGQIFENGFIKRRMLLICAAKIILNYI